MKRKILFIGAEQPLWREFRDYAFDEQSVWEAEFAETPEQALAIVEPFRFDAVVSDVRLDAMDGVKVLDRIMLEQPKAYRIILSDIADAQSTMKCVGRAHHHLLKPCDVAMLLNALEQGLALERWLPGADAQELITQMRWVPSPPAIYARVLDELQSPEASVERIGELIAQDPAITAKVLQLANSAVFGLQLQVIHPGEAVAYIGLDMTRSLVLLAHTFSSFNSLQVAGFSAEALWNHSISTGQIARRIAQLENTAPELNEAAFAAGLLHDIGKLLFAANLPKRFARALRLVREENRALWETENQVFGASHAELGACVLGIWGLPMPIVQAVALHHNPLSTAAQGFGPVTAVHVADAFSHESAAQPQSIHASQMDVAYLKNLALDLKIEHWRRECQNINQPVAG